MDEESVVADQGEASGQLWDVPATASEARQGAAGGAGTIALEGRTDHAMSRPVVTVYSAPDGFGGVGWAFNIVATSPPRTNQQKR